MQQLFHEVTGLDILESKTIASACMKHFRTNHLPNSKHLALITEKGYGMDKKFNQSSLARKFLQWYQQEHDLILRTSESLNYEKKIGNYFVDGFTERDGQRPLAVEIHGCYWLFFFDYIVFKNFSRHACPKHFSDDQIVCAGGTTAGEIRRRNLEREEAIREHADLEIYWECEINQMQKKDEGVTPSEFY
jgi:hypothetical protein